MMREQTLGRRGRSGRARPRAALAALAALEAGALTMDGVRAALQSWDAVRARPVTVEWKCEGRIVEWTVPPGATQATIEAWGASGGGLKGDGAEHPRKDLSLIHI